MSLGIDQTVTSSSTSPAAAMASACVSEMAPPASRCQSFEAAINQRKTLASATQQDESRLQMGGSRRGLATDCGSDASHEANDIGCQPDHGVIVEQSHRQTVGHSTVQTTQPPIWIRVRNWALRTHKKYARYMNSRARPGDAYVPTTEEHFANMFTHGVIVPLSILAMFWMLELASNDLQHNIAIIYGTALFVLFGVSTTFHALSYYGQFRSLRNLFHFTDRAVIYIFIAASYTPWLTLKEYDGWGSSTLWIVWIAAMLGIFYQYVFHERYKWLETLFYLAIGVCPSVVCLAMKEKSGIFELAFGGMLYISGVVFFKCDGLIPFAHAIWHCFVTTGAVCHYQAVCTYLLGPHNQIKEEIS